MKKRLEAIRGLKPMAKDERLSFDISNLLVGGYFALKAQNWLVLEVNKYLDVKWKNFGPRKNEEWITELTVMSLKTGEVKYIEYLFDDGIEIYFTEEEIKLRDLGITRTDLENIAEEEEGFIIFQGMKYHYSDDDTAALLYFKGDAEGVPVRCYEFESVNERYITVESWYAEVDDDRPSREAYLSVEVKSSDIEILQLSE